MLDYEFCVKKAESKPRKQGKLSAEFLRSQAKKKNTIHFGVGTSFRRQNTSHEAEAAHIRKPLLSKPRHRSGVRTPHEKMRNAYFL
jgi:hypothetical protein